MSTRDVWNCLKIPNSLRLLDRRFLNKTIRLTSFVCAQSDGNLSDGWRRQIIAMPVAALNLSVDVIVRVRLSFPSQPAPRTRIILDVSLASMFRFSLNDEGLVVMFPYHQLGCSFIRIFVCTVGFSPDYRRRNRG